MSDETNASAPRSRTRLSGLIAAPLTPLQPDGSVNLEAISGYADLLARNGVGGAFVCGTTGEGLSLSVEERLAVTERWIGSRPPSLRIIAHVGHTSLGDARRLAAHAEACGADAVAAMAPCFYRPAGLDRLIDYCAEIAAAAPKTPFYFYHIPSMTGVHVAIAEFLQRARIPTLAGVKYTHGDLVELNRCLQAFGDRYDVLFGRDEMLLPALALGVCGAVGSTYNFAAPLYKRILAAFAAGDLERARADQDLAAKIVDVFAPYGGVAAQKAIMRMIGVDCGGVRLPLQPLTAEQCARLRVDLEALGFFEECANQ